MLTALQATSLARMALGGPLRSGQNLYLSCGELWLRREVSNVDSEHAEGKAPKKSRFDPRHLMVNSYISHIKPKEPEWHPRLRSLCLHMHGRRKMRPSASCRHSFFHGELHVGPSAATAVDEACSRQKIVKQLEERGHEVVKQVTRSKSGVQRFQIDAQFRNPLSLDQPQSRQPQMHWLRISPF
ncbi:unnamed protein product [Symbiodinium sp. CCMP2456]|nr:unnamed protein product [Symbiodinium sp. CCMP2456]